MSDPENRTSSYREGENIDYVQSNRKRTMQATHTTAENNENIAGVARILYKDICNNG